MIQFLKDTYNAPLDSFDYLWAIAGGAVEAAWFGGGAIWYQLVAIVIFKAIKAGIDRKWRKA
jgi:hypothetical protein